MSFNKFDKISVDEGRVTMIKDSNDVILWEEWRDYLYIKNEYDGLNTITIARSSSHTSNKKLAYNINRGYWITFDITKTQVKIPLQKDEVVYLRTTAPINNSEYKYYSISSSKPSSVNGNIASLISYTGLLKYDTLDVDGSSYFTDLFKSGIVDFNAKMKINTISSADAFYKMFSGCSTLEHCSDIVLPNRFSTNSTFTNMFGGCTKLKHNPIKNITDIGDFTFLNTFLNCTNLLDMPDFSKVNSVYIRNGCSLNNAFKNCTSLTKTSVFSAGFNGNLSSATVDTFYGCSSLRETTWMSTTPPTISSGMWNGCPEDMIIYVPDSAVELYKTAAVWISRAAYIKGISEKQ